MKNLKVGVAALAVVLSAGVALAQFGPGARRAGQRGGFRGHAPGKHAEACEPGRPCFGEMMMKRNPLLRALDLDQDGVLSKEEIEKASESLKKLDKNGDGKITLDELRPPWAEERGARGRGDIVSRLMKLDKNGDGKVTKDEVPEGRMSTMFERLLERADTNGDGALDKAELEQIREKIRERAQRARGRRAGARDGDARGKGRRGKGRKGGEKEQQE